VFDILPESGRIRDAKLTPKSRMNEQNCSDSTASDGNGELFPYISWQITAVWTVIGAVWRLCGVYVLNIAHYGLF